MHEPASLHASPIHPHGDAGHSEGRSVFKNGPKAQRSWLTTRDIEDEDVTAVLEFAARQNDHPVLRSA